jgi:putative membrane protein
MIRCAARALPLLAVALAAAMLSSGSFAIAGGDHPAQHRSGDHAKRCHQRCGDHRVSAWDEQWLMMSIEGDLFEIQGGKIARHKTSNEKVRNLAETLIRDHTKSLKEATDLARRFGIEVPGEPSPSQQWELRVVSQFKGNGFDRWYSDLEVQDHIQDIQEASDEVEKGCNPEIRKDARDEIPVLQMHLKLAREALASVS